MGRRVKEVVKERRRLITSVGRDFSVLIPQPILSALHGLFPLRA